MSKCNIMYLVYLIFISLLHILVITPSFARDIKFNAGSGFYINNNGVVLTNKHVVDQCDNKLLLFIDYKQNVHQSKILAVSKEYDLAAINTGVKNDYFGSIATVDDTMYPVMINESGLELFSFGYPNGQKKQEWAAGSSIATSKYNEYPFLGFAKLNATHGCSGSVIMDRSALVLGIVTARFGYDLYKKGDNLNDKQLIVFHNLNAIVDFANKNNIEINHFPRKKYHDPGFVLGHASRISGQIFCWSN